MRSTHRALAGLAAVSLTLSLAACGNDKKAEQSTSAPSVAATTEAETTSADASAPGESEAATTSADAATAPSTSSAPAATEAAAADKSFSVPLPAGWEDATAAAAGTGAVLQARRTEPLGDYQPVVLVTAGTDPGPGLATLVKNTGEKKATEVGAKMTPVAPRSIGGVTAPGYRIVGTVDGKKLTVHEYYVVKSRKLYVITLSAPTAQAAAAGTEIDQVLAGWAWK